MPKFVSDILARANLMVDGVVTFNNTATGQTPASNDNSTKLATTAWVRNFVTPYTLPIASDTVLGGIKVGTGLSIDGSTGVLSTTGGGGSITSFRSEYIITATAGQTTFTVPGGYTPNKIDLFLNGVYLNDYTYTATDSSTVVLNDGALLDDKLTIFVYSTYYVGDSPSARTTTYFTATDNQTTFTVDYVLGQVDIFYNGSKLEPEEYTANNGTSIILTTPCNAGDKIEVVNWATGGGIANTRTLTIDGVSYDLSANRTWNILPTGGAAGEILAKNSATNYDVTWIPNYTSQVQHNVKLAESMTIGTAVYVSGSTGQAGTNMLVSKASNATEGTSSKTLGLIAFTGVTNDIGFVVTEGLLAGLDTSSAGAAGDPVWLGTNGTLIFGLLNKPTAPAHLVFIGVVTRKQQNNGEIFVKVQNGFELDELHDLSVKNASDGDMIKYVASTGLWTKIAATTTNITEGINLYYTQGRFDTAFGAKSTTDLSEGTNLYYTTTRVNSDFDTRLATKSTTNLAEGTNLYYTTARANSDFDTRLATKSTTNLAEGTNLYYTDTRVGTYLTANSYATQSYVSTQINNLVSGAPGLLDTLDELAAALGDDPNFATTVSTALSNRLRIDIGTQGLTSTQQGYGRTNLGLGSLAILSSIDNSYITDLAWSKLTGVPSTFTPSAHTHPISDIVGLQTALDGKEASITAGTTTQYWRGDKTWQTLPIYTLSGLGGVPTTRTITINGTAYDLSADRSWSIAAGVTSFNTRTGAITLSSADVTGALGFTPYNATNPNGYITGVTNISGYASMLNTTDTRTISPSSHTSYRLTFGFTSYSNNNTPDYADYLHLRSYGDSSGGADNLITFKKNGIGMRIWQQAFGSSTAYSSYVDVIHSGNHTSFRGTQLISPNGASVVAADSAMPDTGHSFIHTLGLGPGSNDGHILGMTWANTTTVYGAQIWVDTDPTNTMAFRSRSSGGVWTGWNTIIHSSNISSQSVNYANTAGSASANGGTADYAHQLKWYGAGGTPQSANSFQKGILSNYYGGGAITDVPESTYGSLYNFGGYDASSLSLQLFSTVNHNSTSSTRTLYFRMGNNLGFQNDWKALLDSTNYSSYAVPLSGGVNLSNGLSFTGYNTPNAITVGSGDVNWSFGSYADGGAQYWMQVKYYGTNDDNRGFRIFNVNGSTIDFRVNGSGNGIFRGDVTAYSDARVKENIVTVDNALNKVLSLRGVYYNRIDTENSIRKIGVIAQETLPIIPEVVTKGNDEMYTVAYGNMAGLFIEAIKELKAENDALKEILKRNNII
jgi:hypothetical protein